MWVFNVCTLQLGQRYRDKLKSSHTLSGTGLVKTFFFTAKNTQPSSQHLLLFVFTFLFRQTQRLCFIVCMINKKTIILEAFVSYLPYHTEGVINNCLNIHISLPLIMFFHDYFVIKMSSNLVFLIDFTSNLLKIVHILCIFFLFEEALQIKEKSLI